MHRFVMPTKPGVKVKQIIIAGDAIAGGMGALEARCSNLAYARMRLDAPPALSASRPERQRVSRLAGPIAWHQAEARADNQQASAGEIWKMAADMPISISLSAMALLFGAPRIAPPPSGGHISKRHSAIFNRFSDGDIRPHLLIITASPDVAYRLMRTSISMLAGG